MFTPESLTSFKHRWYWVLPLLVLAGCLGITASAAWSQSNQSGPDVVGLKLDKAIEILEKQGYEVLPHPHSTIYPSQDKKVIAQRYSQEVASGSIGASSKYLSSGSSKQGKLAEIWYYDVNTRQRTPLPEKGGQAKSQADSTVKLITVPSLIGHSQDTAELTLNQMGLGLIVSTHRVTPSAMQNRIIADQYPSSGARVLPNSLVSVTVFMYRERTKTREKYGQTSP
jgi:beta-lactam-binding protein with PASTA domain